MNSLVEIGIVTILGVLTLIVIYLFHGIQEKLE